MSEHYHKIIFELTPDEDNYPPVSAESLWGISKEPDVYEIDNSPYYIYGVSKGDCILTAEKNGAKVALKIVRQGGHSTLRVFAENDVIKKNIIKKLEALGCICSTTKSISLFSVDIPAKCDFLEIDSYLSSISDGEKIAYEDACLQHKKIDPPRISASLSLASLGNALH